MMQQNNGRRKGKVRREGGQDEKKTKSSWFAWMRFRSLNVVVLALERATSSICSKSEKAVQSARRYYLLRDTRLGNDKDD